LSHYLPSCVFSAGNALCGSIELSRHDELGVLGLSQAAGDFNGDGKQDLAICDYNFLVLILPGNGDGSFGTPIATGQSCTQLIAADANGDGKPDLIVAPYQSGTPVVLLGKGDATFVSQAGPPVLPQVVADFDGDANRMLQQRNGRLHQ